MKEGGETEVKKAHRERHSGRKAEKKKKGKESKQLSEDAKKRNPKAFTFKSAVRAQKNFRRKQDVTAKRQHVPEVDRTPLEPPPFVVAVVGPPKVGKTTLIQCLIKNFTKQNLNSIKGPVTIVSGKKRRLTLLECNNDINSMIDVAKIADLVLLIIDASFGFEMEIFEFLNICQVHGFPRIMGVLTHLDAFKNNKALRKRKKLLKHRFSTEIYQGVKLFYLSGVVHGEYQKMEIRNLCRYISVMKFRPILWRQQHPYVLADRMEDITNPEDLRQNEKCDRRVCLYGYLRGVHLKNKMAVHIPDKEKKRSLNLKEKLLYAPMSGVGGLVYDKDAVYMELGGSHSHAKKEDEEDKSMVSSIIVSDKTLEEKLAESQFQLFSTSKPVKSMDIESDEEVQHDESESEEANSESSGDSDNEEGFAWDDSGEGAPPKKKKKQEEERLVFDDSDDEVEKSDSENLEKSKGDERDKKCSGTTKDSKIKEKVSQALAMLDRKTSHHDSSDSDNEQEMGDAEEEEDSSSAPSDSEDEEEGTLRWKDDLAKKAAVAFYERQYNAVSLRRLVYGAESVSQDDVESEGPELGGLFHKVNAKVQEERGINDLDTSKFVVPQLQDWTSEETQGQIRDCWVTGKWEEAKNAETLLEMDDEDVFGDFEDLETGEKHAQEKQQESDDRHKKEVDENAENEKRMAKKRKLKEMFNKEYDENEGDSKYYDGLKKEVEEQSQLNRSEFDGLDDELRIQYEGYRPGMYVRMELHNVPCELVNNFDPTYPLIVGGLLPGEENIGFVQVRLKKHRWHKRILKTRDPLILSLGWRRFQTLPLFFIQDHNMRHRMLKYTPEHLHCWAQFWGPITVQGTGLLAVQSVGDKTADFRIAATGNIVDLDKSTHIVKKLKLTGAPYQIYKKTAFLKDMFSSNLEAAKFEGASIQTVSGIRGQIKKVQTKPEGAVRALFEDKILLSDIVFLRTWYKVDVPQLYNPVTSLLLPVEEKNQWRGMKTAGQLKRERRIKVQPNPDHLYTPINRQEKVFAPLVIPRALQRELPYKDKPKQNAVSSKKATEEQRVAVIREPHEQKVASLMKLVKAVHEKKMETEKEAMSQRIVKLSRRQEKEKDQTARRQKKLKKMFFREIGKMEAANKLKR